MGAEDGGWGWTGDGGQWRRLYCVCMKISGFIIASLYKPPFLYFSCRHHFRLGRVQISQLVLGENVGETGG